MLRVMPPCRFLWNRHGRRGEWLSSFTSVTSLSVTTGRLISPRGWDGLIEILNYMTGDDLRPVQLPSAKRECRPELLRQAPQLAGVQVPGDFGPDPRAGAEAWLAEQAERYGETLPVEPLAPGAHTRVNPLQESARLRGGEPSAIIPFIADPDD
jgi:hypothetical protein